MMWNMWEMKVCPAYIEICDTYNIACTHMHAHTAHRPSFTHIDDRDEEGTISEQEQLEEDKDNDAEIQQLSKEGVCSTSLT